jgi:OFA family oxalate/formate antiporter-like MFS transporter
MAYGGLPPITASFANRMYGPKNYPVNFSILNLFVIPAALLGPAMAGSIQVATASYQSAFYIMLLLSILAGISGMLIKKA